MLVGGLQLVLEAQPQDTCQFARWGEPPTPMEVPRQHHTMPLQCQVMAYRPQRPTGIKLRIDHLIIPQHDLLRPQAQPQSLTTIRVRVGEGQDGCNLSIFALYEFCFYMYLVSVFRRHN